MKYFQCLALVLATAWLFAGAAHASPCSRATVKIDPMADGRIRVPVTVEGRKLSLLLDTGGVVTTIKWERAKEMGLPVRQSVTKVGGVGGSLLNFYVTAQNFSVGGQRVENRPIYIESRNLPDADGTLGSDILRDYDVEIDLARGTLSLTLPYSCTENAGASIAMDVAQDGHIRFPIKLDGSSIVATFDSGSAVSLLPVKAAALLDMYPNSAALALVGGAGPYQIYTHPFQSLEFGDIAIKNPRILIVSDSFIPETASALVLGMEAFRQMHFIIAYGEKRFFILPETDPEPDASRPPTPPP
jgi:predicted aspartyl protease